MLAALVLRAAVIPTHSVPMSEKGSYSPPTSTAETAPDVGVAATVRAALAGLARSVTGSAMQHAAAAKPLMIRLDRRPSPVSFFVCRSPLSCSPGVMVEEAADPVCHRRDTADVCRRKMELDL